MHFIFVFILLTIVITCPKIQAEEAQTTQQDSFMANTELTHDEVEKATAQLEYTPSSAQNN